METDNKEQGSIIDIAKEAVSNITDKVIEMKEDLIGDEQSEILGEFRETGINKIKLVMDEIGSSVQLISKSGYDLTVSRGP